MITTTTAASALSTTPRMRNSTVLTLTITWRDWERPRLEGRRAAILALRLTTKLSVTIPLATSTGVKQTTGQYGSLLWKHTTPAGTSQFDTSANSSSYNRVELDPMGADVGLEAPNPPDTNGGEGDIGANHIGGIMDSRWSNFFDLSGGCSAGGVAASCSGVVSPDGYME